MLANFATTLPSAATSILPRDTPGLLDLPSFPTRRSSDLHGQPLIREFYSAALGSPLVATSAWLGGGIFVVLGSDEQMKKPRKDRKSTRLNSSHVAISYAVFCWKKKLRARKSWALSVRTTS